MKFVIAKSMQEPAFGSIALPQNFIWVTGPHLIFFPLRLKNEPGVLLHGVLLLRLELSLLTAQGRFKAGRPGELPICPQTSAASVKPANNLGDNVYRNGGDKWIKE